MSESAMQAQTRAIAPLLEKITETALLPAERLPVGASVRIGGEWCGFEGMHDGSMLLSTSSAGFTYTPSVGETFAWSSPF